MENNKLAKLVQETIDAMDGAERATPAPFLLTRLHAQLRREEISYWERINFFVCRPVVAVTAVLLVVTLNLFMYTYNGSGNTSTQAQATTLATDEYSMINPAALFDFENTQP